MNKLLVLSAAMLIFSACGQEKEKKEDNVSQVLGSEEPVVDVKVLKRGDFAYETISNGKIEAYNKSDLNFSSSEQVTEIFVVNGQKVVKGQKIASIDKYKLKMQLASAKSSLDKAFLSLQDALISRGYNIKDTTSIPKSEMQLLRTKSGYDDSKNSYELALYNFNNATLYAPFDGTVANLFTKLHNIPVSSSPFCTVIGNGNMTVDFYVLESELPAVKKGGSVDIMLFADNSASVKGTINEVNPVVDKNGLVRIRAVVPHPTESMFDGMNVRVAIRNTVANQLSVPKTSMVNRSGGRKVVFTYKKGLSVWNYVEQGDDNSTDVIINSGLNEGDTVIVSGNANLTYDVKVKINNVLE